MAITWEQLAKLGCELPEVEEGTWFRTPALLVCGKSFARLKEHGETVVLLLPSMAEQEVLTETRSEVYFITDHYRGHPAVLARLARMTTAEARLRLERAWQVKAPKRLLRDLVPAPQRRRRR